MRTSLALEGAGLAVVQFLSGIGSRQGRDIIGVLLVAAGCCTIVAGYVRWRSVQAAMRRAAPLPASVVPLALTMAIALASLVAVAALLFR